MFAFCLSWFVAAFFVVQIQVNKNMTSSNNFSALVQEATIVYNQMLASQKELVDLPAVQEQLLDLIASHSPMDKISEFLRLFFGDLRIHLQVRH